MTSCTGKNDLLWSAFPPEQVSEDNVSVTIAPVHLRNKCVLNIFRPPIYTFSSTMEMCEYRDCVSIFAG
jgi:hypothetical protein